MRRSRGAAQIGIVLCVLVILAVALGFILINRAAIPSWIPIAGFTVMGMLGVSFFLALRFLVARGSRSRGRTEESRRGDRSS